MWVEDASKCECGVIFIPTMNTLPSEVTLMILGAAPDARVLGLCSREYYAIYKYTADYKYWRGLRHPARAPAKMVPILPWSAAEYAAARNVPAFAVALWGDDNTTFTPALTPAMNAMLWCDCAEIARLFISKYVLTDPKFIHSTVLTALSSGSPRIAEYLIEKYGPVDTSTALFHKNTVVYFGRKLGADGFAAKFAPRHGFCGNGPESCKYAPVNRILFVNNPTDYYDADILTVRPLLIDCELITVAAAFARRRALARIAAESRRV